MGNSQYLFRSQFDRAGVIAPLLGTVLFIWWWYYLSSFRMSIGLLILLGVLFNYLLLAIFHSQYYFFENQIVRVFVFRLFYKRKALRYESFKIRYIHAAGLGGKPQFVLFRHQYRKYYLGNLLNTFYFNALSKRVEIVEFLLSKNVNIEVRSDFEKKDKEIIDMVKKKYPNNIR